MKAPSLEILQAEHERSPDGILVVSVDREILACNRRFVTMWGVDPGILATGNDDEALRSVLSRVKDADTFLASTEALYARPLEESLDEVELADGRVFDRRTMPVVPEGGTIPTSRIWFFRDVTERKRLEEDVRRAAEPFGAVAGQHLVGVLVVDLDGAVVYANAAFAEMLRERPEALAGRAGRELIAAADRARVVQILSSVSSSVEGPTQLACRLQRRDGGAIDVVAQMQRASYQGRPAIIGVAIDVTERLRAERTLLASEERFNRMVDNAPDAIVFFDSAADRCLDANSSAEKLFGCSRTEIVRLGLRHFYVPGSGGPEADARLFYEHAREAEKTGRSRFERRIRAADGTERLCEVTLVPMAASSGEVIRASFLDITQRREAESQLERANRVLRTLSLGNRTLVKATSERELLDAMCQLLVEAGGYAMVWVGVAEDDSDKTIRPIAWAGVGTEYLFERPFRWDRSVWGGGPAGTAIRSGRPAVNPDYGSANAPWAEAALRHGFTSSVAVPLCDERRAWGVLSLISCEANAFDAEELDLLSELASDTAFGIETLRTRAARVAADGEVRNSMEQTVAALAGMLEARDPYTSGHSQQVSLLATAIAGAIGFDEHRVEGIRLAAAVHDIGKIRIPSEILSKPGRLSEIEYRLVQTHAETGYELLKNIRFPWPIAEIVWQHHEHVDGGGYPQGLVGDQILLEARIICVADVAESMMFHRPYRPARGLAAALDELHRGSGVRYDAAVVRACITLFDTDGFAFPARTTETPA